MLEYLAPVLGLLGIIRYRTYVYEIFFKNRY